MLKYLDLILVILALRFVNSTIKMFYIYLFPMLSPDIIHSLFAIRAS